jgi:hypothetical protein
MPEQEKAPYRGNTFSPEGNQPDPRLQLSARRTGSSGISLAALALVALMALVFFGLHGRDTQRTAALPMPLPTNAAAPHG